MGMITYGTQAAFIDDDAIEYFQRLVQSIVSQGKTEWFPLKGQTADGDDVTFSILIAPGIPISTKLDKSVPTAEATRRLVQSYLPEDYREPSES